LLGNDYPIAVQNAGLVLLGPFLYTLFNRLDLSTDDGDGSAHFVGIEGASRAVHLLQYLVDTRLDAPAEALPLNKLLCGLSPDAPVWPSLTPAQADLDVCDQLLEAVLGQWQSIGHSSVPVLRESFLQRGGSLSPDGGKWNLTVQKLSFDILLDRIPWQFSVIAGSWMPKPLHVTW
jgi:hypothetical protein